MNGRLLKFLAGAALSSVAMFGASVKVTMVGAPTGNIGPYQADIGSSTTAINVVCDDDSDSVSVGEYWQANETSLYSLMTNESNSTQLNGTMFGGAAYTELMGDGQTSTNAIKYATDIYEAIGYLVLQLINNPGSTNIQDAIWGITNDIHSNSTIDDLATLLGTSKTLCPGPSNSVAYFECQALTTGVSFFNAKSSTAVAEAQQITFLTPTGNGTLNGKSAGTPQEFVMVASPEPGTYAMFGMGLILLSLGTFRRGKKTN